MPKMSSAAKATSAAADTVAGEGRLANVRSAPVPPPVAPSSGGRTLGSFRGEANALIEKSKSARRIPDGLMNMARKADLKQIDRIAKEVGGLTNGQREILHEWITKQNLSLEEIKEIALQIKQLFPNK